MHAWARITFLSFERIFFFFFATNNSFFSKIILPFFMDNDRGLHFIACCHQPKKKKLSKIFSHFFCSVCYAPTKNDNDTLDRRRHSPNKVDKVKREFTLNLNCIFTKKIVLEKLQKLCARYFKRLWQLWTLSLKHLINGI